MNILLAVIFWLSCKNENPALLNYRI